MNEPPAGNESLEELFTERDWPVALLRRADELRLPRAYLEQMIRGWNAPLERIELEVDWADRVLNGPIRYRQLHRADGDAFSELWANSPEAIGEWDVTVLRGPNSFAQFQLQERPVLNGLFDGGVMVACVSFSLRNTIVAGERLSVRYGQAMRVHKDHRRHGYANWVRSIPWAIGIDRYTQMQYDYLRSHNMTMERWNRKFMPNVASVPTREDEVPGLPVTVLQIPARGEDGPAGVRPAREADIARCVDMINRTHHGRDLFRPYSAERLSDRLDEGMWGSRPPVWTPVYSWADFFVAEQAGQVVACGGLWDRGRDVRERWVHRERGDERTISVTAMLDAGHAEGHEDALAGLIEHFAARTRDLGRDYLSVHVETMPVVAGAIAHLQPEIETRYLQWRADTPPLRPPPYVDLVYW
jgi:GNAT superfamily N-acetyltransferase